MNEWCTDKCVSFAFELSAGGWSTPCHILSSASTSLATIQDLGWFHLFSVQLLGGMSLKKMGRKTNAANSAPGETLHRRGLWVWECERLGLQDWSQALLVVFCFFWCAQEANLELFPLFHRSPPRLPSYLSYLSTMLACLRQVRKALVSIFLGPVNPEVLGKLPFPVPCMIILDI